MGYERKSRIFFAIFVVIPLWLCCLIPGCLTMKLMKPYSPSSLVGQSWRSGCNGIQWTRDYSSSHSRKLIDPDLQQHLPVYYSSTDMYAHGDTSRGPISRGNLHIGHGSLQFNHLVTVSDDISTVPEERSQIKVVLSIKYNFFHGGCF